MHRHSPRHRLLSRLSIVTLAIACASPAWALQDGPPGGRGDGAREREMGGPPRGGLGGGMRGVGLMRRFADGFRPEYLRRDMPMIREQLKLDEAQSLVIQTLLSDYEEAFGPASQAAQSALQEEAQQMMQGFLAGGMRERMEQSWEAVRADLEQLRAETGGEIDPEVRNRIIRERMEKLSQEIQAEREKSGANAEMRESIGRMIDIVERWKAQRTRMRDDFVAGLRATLNETQAADWQAFDRFMRRERSLPHGAISGESVNLLKIVDDANLSDEIMASIEPILIRYEMELDAALRSRDAHLDQSEIRFLRAAQSFNQREVEELARRSAEMHRMVRDVNDRYRMELVAALPEELRKPVERAALVAGYDRVYRPTQVERAFEVALGLEDLSPEVRPVIEGLQSQFNAEIASLNERILMQIQRQEPQDVVEDATRMMSVLNGQFPMGGMGGDPFGRGRGQSAGPLEEMMSKRGDLSNAYMRRLRDALTPEQQAKLPQRGRGPGRGGMGGFGGGMGALGDGRIADMPEAIRDRVRQYDSNNDGIIDETERAAAMEGLRQQWRQGGMGFGRDGGGEAPPPDRRRGTNAP